MGATPQDVVALFLRAQNLEQVRRIDEAIELYEEAVRAHFDSAGPYDRLIAIYSEREQNDDVSRVASAALEHVRTFEDKRKWYASMRERASEAHAARPDRRGAEF